MNFESIRTEFDEMSKFLFVIVMMMKEGTEKIDSGIIRNQKYHHDDHHHEDGHLTF